MQRISYAGGAFITGDEIAEAVLDYASSLARNGEVDVVEVRVREDDGSLSRVRMLLGASMPIATTALPAVRAPMAEELYDEESVTELRRRTAEGRWSARALTAQEVVDWQVLEDISDL